MCRREVSENFNWLLREFLFYSHLVPCSPNRPHHPCKDKQARWPGSLELVGRPVQEVSHGSQAPIPSQGVPHAAPNEGPEGAGTENVLYGLNLSTKGAVSISLPPSLF